MIIDSIFSLIIYFTIAIVLVAIGINMVLEGWNSRTEKGAYQIFAGSIVVSAGCLSFFLGANILVG